MTPVPTADDPMIYLDAHATTPLDPRVLAAMQPAFGTVFGNPSSRVHRAGQVAADLVDASRAAIARAFDARPEGVVFTSGATEANNLALFGLLEGLVEGGAHAVTQRTEHPSVLAPLRALAARGVQCTILEVDSEGRVEAEAVRAALRRTTRVVSIMLVNNEIGTVQPIPQIAAACREAGVFLHVDAVQAPSWRKVGLRELGADLLSLSAHKFGGPKGIGALILRSGLPPLVPRLFGGGQEGGLRSGTLNVPGIVGFAKAVELADAERESTRKHLAALRDRLFAGLRERIPDVLRNGSPDGHPGNLSLTFPRVRGEALLLGLNEVAVSSGAACGGGSLEPSPVLLAIGRSPAEARASLRFGVGRTTTEAEIDAAVLEVAEVVRKAGGNAGRSAGPDRGHRNPG